ncbi:MAG: hypothetical protein H6551_05330 [Chitinophagales bacterium]|nr:hypothetical protein [Chitinophagaceae bacterium]MCB9064551.1 hypothetical protein [Chitinophagales bacterium]
MKHLALFIGIILLASACHKIVDPPKPVVPNISRTWKLNKTWDMWGFHVISTHPSSGTNNSHSKDTLQTTKTITVINDTTIHLKLTGTFSSYGDNIYDTFCLETTDQSAGMMEFVPKIFLHGTRYRKTNITYYYNNDSVTYFFEDSGVSFHDSLWLSSK